MHNFQQGEYFKIENVLMRRNANKTYQLRFLDLAAVFVHKKVSLPAIMHEPDPKPFMGWNH